MTVEKNECDVPYCRTPLNNEDWCYVVRKAGGKMEAMHNRCLMEKVEDFDSTQRDENSSSEGES